MQPAESSQSHWRILCAILVFFASQNLTALCYGQARDRHLQQFADLPPGQVGQMQLSRGGPLAGYFQPVRMTVPKGAQVSLWAEDHFEAFEANSAPFVSLKPTPLSETMKPSTSFRPSIISS